MAWKILTFSILATVTIKHVTVSKKYICKKTSVNIRIIKFWETCNVINYKWNDACSSYVRLKRVTSLLNNIHMHISIGADSTGATGNFAPVLTQEPGQTLRFAPVPFMAVLWFLKWTLQLYLLNLTKGAKFAGSGHPMTKMRSASGGFTPLTPWPGALPLDPAGGSAPRPPL